MKSTVCSSLGEKCRKRDRQSVHKSNLRQVGSIMTKQSESIRLTSPASPPRPRPLSSPLVSGRQVGLMGVGRTSGDLKQHESGLQTCGDKDAIWQLRFLYKQLRDFCGAYLPVLGLADFIPLPGRGVGAGGPESGDWTSPLTPVASPPLPNTGASFPPIS